MWFRLLLLPVLAATARAGIEWDTTAQTFTAKPGQQQVTAEFHFKNTGPGELNVRAVKVSCECVAAGVDKDRLAPGVSGTLTAIFHPGDRTGHHEKIVVVETDDAKQPVSALKLSVDIPEVMHLDPRALVWKKDEPPAAKTIRVTVAQGVEIAELTAQTKSHAITTKLDPPATGSRDYLLTVTPHAAAGTVRAVVSLHAKFRPSGEKTVSAYVGVL